MPHFIRRACLVAATTSLAACSSLSTTRQLNPDHEPAAPHYRLGLDTAALPRDSVNDNGRHK